MVAQPVRPRLLCGAWTHSDACDALGRVSAALAKHRRDAGAAGVDASAGTSADVGADTAATWRAQPMPVQRCCRLAGRCHHRCCGKPREFFFGGAFITVVNGLCTVVVVVEARLACAQGHFCQSYQGLGSGPSLCVGTQERSWSKYNNFWPQARPVGKCSVVPILSTALCLDRPWNPWLGYAPERICRARRPEHGQVLHRWWRSRLVQGIDSAAGITPRPARRAAFRSCEVVRPLTRARTAGRCDRRCAQPACERGAVAR